MTEPTDDELERAERIKRLRAGEAVPRRERRRPAPPDAVDEVLDGPAEADETDETGTDPANGNGGSRTDDGGVTGGDDEGTPVIDDEGMLQVDDDAVPADAPDDLSVGTLYLRDDLRERLVGLEGHLDSLLGRNFGGDVDGQRHVRPLAMYLGVRQIERLDAGEILALFENIEEIESPR